jgi:hypothetical protein
LEINANYEVPHYVGDLFLPLLDFTFVQIFSSVSHLSLPSIYGRRLIIAENRLVLIARGEEPNFAPINANC